MIGGKISQSKKRPLRKNIKADHLSLVSLRLFYFIYFFLRVFLECDQCIWCAKQPGT